jgi:type IV pilus assembly protein PilA
MLQLRQKRKDKRGFTLMEMLIVVAIIAILIAIAIPTFSSSLDEARESADQANLRAAKAVVAVKTMADADYFWDASWWFNNVTGDFVKAAIPAATTEGAAYGKSTANAGKTISYVVEDDGTVTTDVSFN